MALTKGQIRTAISGLVPDLDRHIWSAGNLDVLTQLVLDEIWSEVLIHNPWFTSAKAIVASGSLLSPGYLSLGALSARFFKLQKIIRDSQQFYSIDPRDVLLVDPNTTETVNSRFGYFVKDGNLWLSPLSMTSSVEVHYSYLPAAYTSVADSAVLPSYPDGMEGAVVFETAARTQIDAQRMANLHAIAQSSFDRLLNRAKREGGDLAVERSVEDIVPWGSI